MPIPIPVLDFRRQSMFLQWSTVDGSWTACDVPPPRVHGIALIRPGQPNICLFAKDGVLFFQVGTARFAITGESPHLHWRLSLVTFGLRRRFSVESSSGERLFKYSYWRGAGEGFFSWLVARVPNPEWREQSARRWSEGMEPSALRIS